MKPLKPTRSRREFLQVAALGAAGAALSSSARATTVIPEKLVLRTGAPIDGKRYGVGIIGCGARSEAHVESILAVPQLQIRALCDILPDAIVLRQRQVGTPVATYRDFEKLVADPRLDAVVIVTPNDTHRDIAIAAFESGKHVLCEKPMALQVRDCDAMLAAQALAGRVLVLGNQRRHAPARVDFVRRVHAGAIGQVLYAWMHDFRRDWRRMYRSEEDETRLNWRYSDRRSGGLTFEMSIHGIDHCNWIMASEPLEVVGMGGFNNPLLRPRDSTDHVGFSVRYDNGAMLNYGASLYSSGGVGPDVISGTTGAALMTGDEMQIVRRDYGQVGGLVLPAGTESIKLARGNNGTTELHSHFAAAMAGEVAPTPDGRDGRRGVQVARAAELSFLEKRYVRISELR